jgi:hypothetical protein
VQGDDFLGGVGGRHFTLNGSSHGGLHCGLEQGLAQPGFGAHSLPPSLNVIFTSSSPVPGHSLAQFSLLFFSIMHFDFILMTRSRDDSFGQGASFSQGSFGPEIKVNFHSQKILRRLKIISSLTTRLCKDASSLWWTFTLFRLDSAFDTGNTRLFG